MVNITILRMLAPFCPHVSEEIYLNMFKDEIGKISIHATHWPAKDKKKYDPEEIKLGALLIEIIAHGRQQKAIMRLALNEPIKLAKITVPKEYRSKIKEHQELIKLPLHISELKLISGEELTIKIEKE
ncbi:MAG: class I tRNA ligase family protein [Candidatus Heimdallarchaeota archaeon]|nr:class I tRNA ligase family protein [Candidatus Heimdallarchaeota archaeon]